jgi:hypothetical protein
MGKPCAKKRLKNSGVSRTIIANAFIGKTEQPKISMSPDSFLLPPPLHPPLPRELIRV